MCFGLDAVAWFLPILGFSYNDALSTLWGETLSLFIASGNCFFLIHFVRVCVALALGGRRRAKPVTSLQLNQWAAAPVFTGTKLSADLVRGLVLSASPDRLFCSAPSSKCIWQIWRACLCKNLMQLEAVWQVGLSAISPCTLLLFSAWII